MIGRNHLSASLWATLAITTSLTSSYVITSRENPAIKVDYKETTLCQVPGAKSYSGYITVPSTYDPAAAPYDSHFFFWFFEASEVEPEEAPLTLWLQGGPGAASTDQAVSGHSGPCIVQTDSNSTAPNPWSWARKSNLLYLDQPVQVGFSYDEAVPGSVAPLEGFDIVTGEEGDPFNLTVRGGTFASQDPERTANTTNVAARAVYNFLQLWFEEFKDYRRDNVNVWSQSYGGHWAPAVAEYIMKEKDVVKKWKATHHSSCSHDKGPFVFGVETVGIINGFIDMLIQGPYYPEFAINNTYGIKVYSEEIAQEALRNATKPDGCIDAAKQCRELAAKRDPDNYDVDEDTRNLCALAFEQCWVNVYQVYDDVSGRHYFDIGARTPMSFPPYYGIGFLNNEWVRKELGAKVNYTESSNMIVMNHFFTNGDFVKAGFLEAIGSLLDAGVRVSLINGDRDFRCNWFGGEAVSLATEFSGKEAFASAGYAKLQTNSSYDGGFVRQHGGFSFVRVFDAGHEVPMYQPETAYELFVRTLAGRDLATGRQAAGPDLSTSGPASVRDVTNEPPAIPAGPECYVDFPQGCTAEQAVALAADSAVVGPDRVVTRPAGQWNPLFGESS